MSLFIIDNAYDLLPAEKTPTIDLCKTLSALKIPYNIIRTKNDLEKFHRPLGFILTGTTVYTPAEEIQKKVALNASALVLYPEIPILGICWGFQILAQFHGGIVDTLQKRNEGEKITTFPVKHSLFNGIHSSRTLCKYSHNNYIVELPKKWIPIGISWASNQHHMITVAACHIKYPRYGVLFHPELREETTILLKNFYNICRTRTPHSRIANWWKRITQH